MVKFSGGMYKNKEGKNEQQCEKNTLKILVGKGKGALRMKLRGIVKMGKRVKLCDEVTSNVKQKNSIKIREKS